MGPGNAAEASPRKEPDVLGSRVDRWYREFLSLNVPTHYNPLEKFMNVRFL